MNIILIERKVMKNKFTIEEIENILLESIINPDKQKTLPIMIQNKNWFLNGVMKNLIRHFAYWLNIEMIKKDYEEQFSKSNN
jgi:hypothetical protein